MIEIETTDLKSSLAHKFRTQKKAAEALHISRLSLNQKLNSKQEWTAKRIQIIIQPLNISDQDIFVLF